MTTPVVGKDIDAWCGKCKLVLAHVIVALKDGDPHRVQCKTCEAVHAFKTEEPAKPTKSTASKRRAGPSEYDRRLTGRDLSTASPYKLTSTYRADELIKHRTLGYGLVTEQIGDSKVEVLFPDGPKLLVCGR